MSIEEAKNWVLHYQDEIAQLKEFIKTNSQES